MEIFYDSEHPSKYYMLKLLTLDKEDNVMIYVCSYKFYDMFWYENPLFDDIQMPYDLRIYIKNDILEMAFNFHNFLN